MLTMREARARRVLTVRDLAAAAGLAPTTVYRIEHGISTPRFGVIRALAAVLEVEPAEVAEFAAAMETAGQRPVETGR